jgi:hypothetical protein
MGRAALAEALKRKNLPRAGLFDPSFGKVVASRGHML